MIITLVPREKKQKGCLLYQWNWNAFSKSQLQKKTCFLTHYPESSWQKFVRRKHRTPNLWQMKLFSENFYSPPHPYMTHLTPPHPCMTHPTLPHPTPPFPTPPLEQFWEEMGWISWGPLLCLPFGRQWIPHLSPRLKIYLIYITLLLQYLLVQGQSVFHSCMWRSHALQINSLGSIHVTWQLYSACQPMETTHCFCIHLIAHTYDTIQYI